MQEQAPKFLYKIVSHEQWGKSLVQNEVVWGLIDKDFIHLATAEQLPQIAKKFWNNMDYIVLTLDPPKLIGRLVWESNPGGTTKYYHLYEGVIPLEAVVDLRQQR